MDEDSLSVKTSQKNEPALIDFSSQKQKPNYWKIAFFTILFLLVISNGVLFSLFKIKNENSTKDQSRNLIPITSVNLTPQPTNTTSNTSGLLPLELLSLTSSEKLNFNQVYKILWKNQDLERWGDEIIVCLIGFDSSGKEIPGKKEWNEQLCTYRSGDLSGAYLIAKTKLSTGTYDWTIPNDLFDRYLSQPIKFKIRLLVFDNLPAEGRTEWAGSVGWDESKDYLLIRNKL